MERLVLLSARRLDLDMVPWPAAMPCSRLLGPKPRPRELTLSVQVRKVRIGLASKRREARDSVAQFARPVVGSKIIQQANELFVNLFSLFFCLKWGGIGVKRKRRTKCSPMIPTKSVSSVDTGALKLLN